LIKKETEKGIYNVKAISKKIGIQPGTLRAWERRYQIVTPKRNEVGHRIYSEQDLAILKWLVEKVNQGFTISQAADLLSEKTKETPSIFTTDEILDSKKEEITQNLFKALIQFNEQDAELLFEYALSLYRIEVVLFEVMSPLLQLTTSSSRLISKGQIQFLQNWVRMKLLVVFQQIPLKPFLPKVVTVTPDEKLNYQSEIEILLYSIFLKLRGFEVFYLGHLQELSLEQILQRLQPLFIFSIQPEESASIQRIKNWIDENNLKVKLGILGGQTEDNPSEIFIGNQISDWMEWLNQYFHKNQMAINF